MTEGSAAAALCATAARLWPPPARVSITDAGQERETGHVIAEFALLPSAAKPRLAVPLHAPRVAGRMLQRFSHDLAIPARALRAFAAGIMGVPGVTATLGAALRHRLVVTAPDTTGSESLSAWLAEVLGVEATILGLGVGTARANRKPVLPVCDRDGALLAFLKIGDTDVAKDLVRGEARALREFTATGSPAGLDVPRVLYHDTWHGLEVLALTPLRTTRRRWQARDSVPRFAMRDLAEHLGTSRMPLAATPTWRAMKARTARVAEREQAATLRAAIAAVEREYGEQVVTVGCWHGDWTAWNMSWRQNRVQLWDFERFETGAPIGLDYAHYLVQSTLRTGGTAAAEGLLDAGLPTDPIVLASNPIGLVEATYLLRLADRYVHASQLPEGEPLRPRTDWLLGLIHRRWS